jgi:hypothetical protein
LNGEANRVRKKQSSAIIAADVRRFGHVINKDGVLGTHSQSLWGFAPQDVELVSKNEDFRLPMQPATGTGRSRRTRSACKDRSSMELSTDSRA